MRHDLVRYRFGRVRERPDDLGVSDDMSLKVAVKSIAWASIPANFMSSVPYLTAADVFNLRFLVARDDHHFLLMLTILSKPGSQFLLGRDLYPLQLWYVHEGHLGKLCMS